MLQTGPGGAINKRARVDPVYHPHVIGVHFDTLHERADDLSLRRPVSVLQSTADSFREFLYAAEY